MVLLHLENLCQMKKGGFELKLNDKKKVLLYITYSLVLFFILYRIHSVAAIGKNILGIVFPFLIGGFLAFLLSLPMNWIEKKLFSKHTKSNITRFKRPISLLLTFILVFGILFIVSMLIVPAVTDAVQKIVDTVPGFLMNLVSDLEKWNLPADELEQWVSQAAINWSLIGQKILEFLRHWSTGVVSSTFGVVSSVVQGVTNSVISFIFAIYILCSKEKLHSQFRMLLYAFLPEAICDEVFRIGSLIHRTFSSFFAGQCLEACILGMMFVVSMTILRIPYAILIGVLIAITALIPVFGAFIGCVTGAFLILMVDPMKALIFLVLFLILQQLEGNLIYPKVVGNSVGLPSIWVLVAVTTGASAMGILGMLLFIPLFSVVYSLLRENTNKRLAVKKISKEKYKK